MSKIVRISTYLFVWYCACMANAALADTLCEPGNYLPANTTSCAVCPNGYYCDGGTFAQSTTDQGINKCPPADNTTQRTTFPDKLFPYNPATGTYDRSGGITINHFRNQGWREGWTDIGHCLAYYRFSTAASKQVNLDNVAYNPSTGKYDIDDFNDVYYEYTNEGYYLDTIYSISYCYTATNPQLYKRAVVCPSGSYCPGITFVPWCGDGPQASELGRNDCPAGAYCPAGTSAPILCPSGTYGASAGASDAGVCKKCTGATYTDIDGATECTPCPTATALKNRVTEYWYWDANGVHNHSYGCRASVLEENVSGLYTASCSLCDGDYGVNTTCGTISCMAHFNANSRCHGGYYWAGGSANVWAQTEEKIKNAACIPVGGRYWSADGDLTRTACPAGQSTIGYGPGADEAADCGHALHVGDATVYLRSVKETTPSLNVKIGDVVFYGNMSTAVKGNLRVRRDGITYSIYDDSM